MGTSDRRMRQTSGKIDFSRGIKRKKIKFVNDYKRKQQEKCYLPHCRPFSNIVIISESKFVPANIDNVASKYKTSTMSSGEDVTLDVGFGL